MISRLQTRLGRFPNVKKDGTSCAGKVIQPVIKLLHDDNTEAVLVSSTGELTFFVDYFHVFRCSIILELRYFGDLCQRLMSFCTLCSVLPIHICNDLHVG